MYARLACLCLWIQSVLNLADCNLHSKFKEFDELTPDNFTVVVKRNAVSGQAHMKIVTFFALKKYFVLHLVPGSPVLRKDFQAHMVDGDGRITPVHVDQQIFYTGYLNGNPQHSVDAVHTDDVWIAQIHSPDDVYSIEPLTHHVPDSPATLMLIFKQRDINSSIFNGYSHDNATLHPFCEEVQFKQYPLSDSLAVKQRSHIKKNTSVKTSPHTRKARQSERDINSQLRDNIFMENRHSETHLSKDNHSKVQFMKHQDLWKRSNFQRKFTTHDTCEMLVIADFEAYKGIGQSSIFRMISIFVFLYQSLDRIYRATYFGILRNLGIVIAKFIVHTEYTAVVDNNHYNMAKNKMSGIDTLVAMARVSNFSNFCLVHLTTQRHFGGTLGVAATAEEFSDAWGNGICAMSLMEARNIGLSTPITAKGQVMPFTTYLLVIAHELGHNWGSHHDPTDDPECSPSSENGGKYIMWAYSGHASSSNARKFSPCARREIARALNAKAHMCFMPRNLAVKVCGNSIVEPGEDCDVGYLKDDPCCTQRCRYQDNAVCSPINNPCCTSSCQIAPPTQKCFVDIQDCHQDAFCSGTESHTCPEPQPLPNNSTCQSLGKCWQGKCVSFCELLGATFTPTRRLIDCVCDKDRISMCYHCCWDPEIMQACTKMGGTKIDGTPCMLGVCDKGMCMETKMTDSFLFDKMAQPSRGSNNFRPSGFNDILVAITAICLGWRRLIL
ncbi:unnamed protein product [Candidula unifasciata]|uniref:Uncharacterized protein n=1 Tax=Candidula unifasciata TaxID=100452 RepID=A0A8S3ZF97_9EUPU|nr:unnamed protein product [Candidula unifasciata]